MADMQLIDVNTLWKCETCFYDSKNGCRTYCDHGENYRPAYDKLKTIDPESLRPVGEWAIEGEDIIWGNSLKRRYCTNCCERPHFDKEKRKFILTPYCPHCGARMKGETK